MTLLTSLLAAIELTGGERIVLRSGELPHLIVAGKRHDLGTGTVSTAAALESLADQILSASSKQALSDEGLAVEPLDEKLSAVPVVVTVRRIGHDMCVELRRAAQHAAKGAAPVPPETAVPPTPAPPSQTSKSGDSPKTSRGARSTWSRKATEIDTAGAASVIPPEPAEAIQPEPPAPPQSATFPPESPAAQQPDETQRLESEMLAFSSENVEASTPAEAIEEDVLPAPVIVEETLDVQLPDEEPPAITPDRNGMTSFVGMASARLTGDANDGLDGLLRQAVQREATALYLHAGQVPLARINDRIEPLSADCIDSSLMDTINGAFGANPAEGDVARAWTRRYEGLGEVSGQAFADDQGSAIVLRLQSSETGEILERDIPRHVRFVCTEDDGVVFVCGTTTTSVLEMVAKVANWTASRRSGHLISIEPPTGLGRTITGSFVSARRVKGTDGDIAEAVAHAVDEGPDVLVVGLAPAVAVEEALRCCRAGRLVILGVVAATAPQALDSLLTWLTPQRDEEVRQSLATWFRCAFSYRPVRGNDGRRRIVYDMLIATPEMQARLERWERWDVRAVEELQRTTDGMLPLDAALAHAVDRGDISVRHAVAHALDPRALVGRIRQSAREMRGRRAGGDDSDSALRETAGVA